jgi:thioredoxin 1
MALSLNDRNFHLAVDNNKAVLVDFWAPWCKPCNMMNPLIERMSSQFTDIIVAKVNTEENPAVTDEFKVNAIPTILFFKNGTLVHRLTGLQTEASLQQKITALLLG